MNPLKTFRIPLVLTVIAVVGAGILGGPKVGLVVALLAVLEISISFDNAIVNAAVLKTMSEKWQKIFLTWGILIAVFGMRLIFPIVIVSLAAGIGLHDVVDLALNNQDEYARHLTEAYPDIAAFGGIFLLLVFLNFFLDEDKDTHWLGPIERPLAKLGHIDAITSAIAAIVLLLLSQFVKADLKEPILVSGLAGMIAYLLSNGVAGRLEESLEAGETEDEVEDAGASAHEVRIAAASAVAKGGLASFLYLELLDASFSFDGVIGAFAISTDIIVIAIGLGLGAIYIRTMTVYLVRAGTLSEYRFLEHGAHWAIGILAVLLFIGIEHHIPEVVTGSLGALTIILAFAWSVRANRLEDAEDAEAAGTRSASA
ncbi:MAG: DUF475 domain-containing protein [Solirubrobacteraceae bacterium]|nr:DUF475 domain-containing protein [Patulibacter sp.]